MTRARRPSERSKRDGVEIAEPSLVPVVIWSVSDRVITSLDERFSDPTDAYVNGSQVWIRDDEGLSITLEWRLHPVPGFVRPPKVDTAELFSRVAVALGTGERPISAATALWDGLECFAAYGDVVSVERLAERAQEVLGLEATAYGNVDHETVALRWEKSQRKTSIVGDLLGQLGHVTFENDLSSSE